MAITPWLSGIESGHGERNGGPVPGPHSARPATGSTALTGALGGGADGRRHQRDRRDAPRAAAPVRVRRTQLDELLLVVGAEDVLHVLVHDLLLLSIGRIQLQFGWHSLVSVHQPPLLPSFVDSEKVLVVHAP